MFINYSKSKGDGQEGGNRAVCLHMEPCNIALPTNPLAPFKRIVMIKKIFAKDYNQKIYTKEFFLITTFNSKNMQKIIIN
jgi:hypothetical protein